MPKGIHGYHPPCKVPGCDKPSRGYGWCHRHYMRWRKHGDPLVNLRPELEQSRLERFWAKVNTDGPPPSFRPDLGPCWLWTAHVDADGYGRFEKGSAHVAAYELLVGLFPKGLTTDHLCRVHPCVKAIANEQGPAHLEPVTQAENRRRAAVLVTHCPRGHPYSVENTYISLAGHRFCRACNSEAGKRYRAKRSRL